MDPAIIGYCRIGYFRIGVFRDIWDQIVRQFEAQGCGVAEVTLRSLSLGSADATTGWYAESYTESTIDMIIADSRNVKALAVAGQYCSQDALGITADVVKSGDQIVANNKYYYVDAVHENYDLQNFVNRVCDLRELPFEAL